MVLGNSSIILVLVYRGWQCCPIFWYHGPLNKFSSSWEPCQKTRKQFLNSNENHILWKNIFFNNKRIYIGFTIVQHAKCINISDFVFTLYFYTNGETLASSGGPLKINPWATCWTALEYGVTLFLWKLIPRAEIMINGLIHRWAPR